LVHVDNVLKRSKWFQRSMGYDHVILLTAFAWHFPQFLTKDFHSIKRCNVLQFGEGLRNNTDDDRLRFDTFYVGSRCSPWISFSNKTDDLALIATLHKKRNKRKTGNPKHFHDRKQVCDWTSRSNHSMGVCGDGSQCPALSNAKLGFHIRGDSCSAGRLFDTLLSGTVPIFTLDCQFTAHQSFIDWNKLVFFIRMGENGANETLFHHQLGTILNNEKLIEEKTKRVLNNRDLFDWDTLVPFDTYMYMYQAYLWPETRVPANRSRYSALILPPQISSS